LLTPRDEVLARLTGTALLADAVLTVGAGDDPDEADELDGAVDTQ